MNGGGDGGRGGGAEGGGVDGGGGRGVSGERGRGQGADQTSPPTAAHVLPSQAWLFTRGECAQRGAPGGRVKCHMTNFMAPSMKPSGD